MAWIMVGYLLITLSLSLALPLGEAADEVSHRAYVHDIAHVRLPTKDGAAAGEAHQPPLYYALVALVTAWMPRDGLQVQANPDFSLAQRDPPNLLLHPAAEAWPFAADAWLWHVIRLVSVAMGAVTVWTTYRLARESFPDDKALAWGAAGFVAFLPGFTLVSAALNNDNLIIMLSALTAWQWVRLLGSSSGREQRTVIAGSALCDEALSADEERDRFAPPAMTARLGNRCLSRQPLDAHQGAVFGLLLGLAALTKLTGFLLWGVSAVVLAWRAVGSDRRQWVKTAVATLLPALLICGPWLLYGAVTYGDPLGWSRLLSFTPRLTPITWTDWMQHALGMYTSFWGRYGGASQVWLPTIVYTALAIIPLAAVAGLARGIVQRSSTVVWPGRLIVFVLFPLLVLASHLRFVAMMVGADLARHVFPALPPLAIVIVAGIRRLACRQAWAMALLVVAMALLSVGVVAQVIGTYSPRTLNTLPAVGRSAEFGGEIRIVYSQLQAHRGELGTEAAVEIHWQALSEPTEVYGLLLRAIGPDGVAVTHDGVAAAGRVTTDRWRTGQVFVSRHALLIPAAMPPGTYRIELGLHPAGRWQWLPVNGGDMLHLGDVRVGG